MWPDFNKKAIKRLENIKAELADSEIYDQYHRTEGIVLRTYKLGEADRIIVLLTPDKGMVRQ